MAQMIEYRAEPEWLGMVTYPSDTPLTAAGIPVKPPKHWFDDPKFSRLTPLTVTSDGQVYGHIASWDSSHIGRLGKVRPPRSKTQYAYFRTGEVETEDGTMVPVGQITLTGGHAPLEASASAAVAHYDNTHSAVMDVAAGEDAHGIWVAGGLRPDVDDVKIRAIRASSFSGDWRPVDHSLELVAICAVNVPGFPIPRALAASADTDSPEIYALVAAGTEALVALTNRDPLVAAASYVMEDIETKMDWLREALSVLNPEEQFSEGTGEVSEGIEAVADGTMTELVVEGGEEQPETDETAETIEVVPDPIVEDEPAVVEDEPDLGSPDDDGESETMGDYTFTFSDSLLGEDLANEIAEGSAAEVLWDDNLPLHFSTAQAEAVALRLRFRGAVVTVDPEARAASAEAGIAMPDGRFPIQSIDDVVAALQILPEGTPYWDHVSARAAELGIDDLASLQEEVLTAAATKAKYDFGARLKMVKTGEAMVGGAFPVKDEEDLRNAIQSIGRAKDPAAARAHVMKRARALRLVNLLPEKWSD